MTFEVSLQDSMPQMLELIQAELQKRGEPLNWFVIDVDPQRQVATVEALIRTESGQAAESEAIADPPVGSSLNLIDYLNGDISDGADERPAHSKGGQDDHPA
jgi:hypothetical protein